MRTVLLALLLTACGSAALAEPEVTMAEFSIDTQASWPSGRLSVPAHNAGEFPHTLVVATADGTVVAASAVIAPGEQAFLTADLPPGRYRLTCRIVVRTPDGDLVDHYAEGMAADVEVTGP